MRMSANSCRSAVVASLAVLAGCGGKPGSGEDGGAVVWDAVLGTPPDAKATETAGNDGSTDALSVSPSDTPASDRAGNGGSTDAPSRSSPDTPAPAVGGRDGGTGDGLGGDRGYLPVDPPDGGMPACIWALMRRCCGSPSDRCIWQTWDGGTGDYICWPTGELDVVDNRASTITAYSSDGTVCYTQKPMFFDGGYSGVAFYDSTGQLVAAYRYPERGTQVLVECDGATFVGTPPFSCVTAGEDCRSGGCRI